MSEWHLGIDFGTSYTVASIFADNNVTVLDVESNGRSRMPSSVFITADHEILVGSAAQHQAVFSPERYEPTPKRSLGEGSIFLGDDLIEVTELVAAVLKRVYSEASRQRGETAPTSVHVTHPADWAQARLDLLSEAIEQAQLPRYGLVAEPVAAAARIGLTTTSPGDHVAVYDFGGGTFDAAVLRRTTTGFEVAGPPGGRDPLGGEDIDQKIVDHLGAVLGGDDPEGWARLSSPDDVAWRRHAAGLRSEVQRAKETLSEVTVCQLWVPGIDKDIQLTRAEIEELISADIDATVDVLEQVFADAGLAASDLSGIYMVGGSSRIPLVADTIWRRLGVRPAVQENPKSVVAMGAAGWGVLSRTASSPELLRALSPELTAPQQEAPAPTAPMPEVRSSGGQPFESVLAAAVGIDSWPEGSACIAELVIDFTSTPPATVRVRDEPARGSVDQLASSVGSTRAARTPGYREEGLGAATVFGTPGVERRFSMTLSTGPVAMVERYAVVDGRAYVMAFPASAVDVAEGISLRPGRTSNPDWFESAYVFGGAPGWVSAEVLRLRRHGSDLGLVAHHEQLRPGTDAERWVDEQFGRLVAQHPGSSLLSRSKAPVLNYFSGELATVSWNQGGARMVAKRGAAVAGESGYSMTIEVPIAQQGQFSSLARQARMRRTR